MYVITNARGQYLCRIDTNGDSVKVHGTGKIINARLFTYRDAVAFCKENRLGKAWKISRAVFE